MMNQEEHVFTERALKQRERILEAARSCFVKRGRCSNPADQKKFPMVN